MQMMTTLNGRLDHPEEWVPEIPGDLYAEIDRIYDSFDTVLVGRTTALEMAEYWPGAETDESAVYYEWTGSALRHLATIPRARLCPS